MSDVWDELPLKDWIWNGPQESDFGALQQVVLKIPIEKDEDVLTQIILVIELNLLEEWLAIFDVNEKSA